MEEQEEIDAISAMYGATKEVEAAADGTPATPEVEKVEVVAEEVKPEAAAEEVKEVSLFDNIDKLDETAIAAEKALSELPESVKAQLVELEALKAEREAEANSDIAKLLKSGLTLEQIAETITKVDYSGFKTTDLIRLELEKAGLSGEDLDAAIEEEVNAYSNLSPLQKAKYDTEIKANYKTEIKLNGASEMIKEALEKNKSVSPAEYAKQQETQIANNIKADTDSLDKYLSLLKVQGEMDEETITAIKNSYSFDKSVGYVKGEKFEALSFIKDQYRILNYDRDVANARKKGFDEAAKKFANPSANVKGTHEAPKPSGNQTYQQAMFGEILINN